MKVYLASDHAGFKLKEKVRIHLSEKGFEIGDMGPYEMDKNDDYPDIIKKAAVSISSEQTAKGIIFGGSGLGEAIVANKYPGIRCGVFYGPIKPSGASDVNGNEPEDEYEIVRLTRMHNDANILSIGSRFVTENQALRAVDIFLATEFSGDPRHLRRIEKIKSIEQTLGIKI